MLTHCWNRTKPLPSIRIDTHAVPDLVSIVLPVYNGANYLAEAIRSVLAQTLPHWELIVVDDGSTDTSGTIADRFAAMDSRIHVLHQENQTLPCALNRGFQKAKGTFFTWLSADNRILPQFLEKLTGELHSHPLADMVFGSEYLIDEAGQRITGHGWFEMPPGSGRVCFPPATPLLNKVANNTIGAAFLYRSGAAAALMGYFPSLYLLEDYDYFMRMNRFFHIHRMEDRRPYYEYRFHKASLTAQDEALGITARRPKLMAWEQRRGREARRPVYANLSDCAPSKTALLRKARIYDGGTIPVHFIPHQAGYAVLSEDAGWSVFYNGEFLANLRDLEDLTAFLHLRLLSHSWFTQAIHW